MMNIQGLLNRFFPELIKIVAKELLKLKRVEFDPFRQRQRLQNVVFAWISASNSIKHKCVAYNNKSLKSRSKRQMTDLEENFRNRIEEIHQQKEKEDNQKSVPNQIQLYWSESDIYRWVNPLIYYTL